MDESKSLCSFTKGMIFWGFFLLGLSDDCEVVSPSTGKQGKKVECWMKVSLSICMCMPTTTSSIQKL